MTYTIVTGDITSSDTQYDALDATHLADVPFQNQDNDAPGILIDSVSAHTTEAGGSATVSFRLLAQPAGGADVTIPLSIVDSTE